MHHRPPITTMYRNLRKSELTLHILFVVSCGERKRLNSIDSKTKESQLTQGRNCNVKRIKYRTNKSNCKLHKMEVAHRQFLIAFLVILAISNVSIALLSPSTCNRISNARRAISAAEADAEVGSNKEEGKSSRRVRFLNKIGFKRMSSEQLQIRKAEEQKQILDEKIQVTTLEELDSYFSDEEFRFRDEKGNINYDALLNSLSVKGDTQIIGSPNHPNFTHPVAKLLHERKANNSKCTDGPRPDGARVALAVEGGGMRGCVSAGMVCALEYLGLRDTVDVVYGSSAGAIVGAYFITGQVPWFGPEIYYDKLTSAGRKFIDTRRLLRALGFGLLDPRLFKDVLTRPNSGKPVLNLSYLLKLCLQETKPLDWKKFSDRQSVQPLKVVASGLKSERAYVFDMESGAFESINELSDCMHASCLLPGIAGPLMNLNTKTWKKNDKPKFVVHNNLEDEDYEPLADALLFEPLPYRVAQKEGATHVVVFRTRPDGTDVTGTASVFERLILRRFFKRKNKLPNMYKYMKMHMHKKLYAQNVIELNDAAKSDRDHRDISKPHLMTIALEPGSEEVTRLETGREAIFEGVRRGFARGYDAFVEDPSERGRGAIVARECFPDEILDYDPEDFLQTVGSSFKSYLEKSGATPATWDKRRKEEMLSNRM